jgi:K+-transporting ATPase A subunit
MSITVLQLTEVDVTKPADVAAAEYSVETSNLVHFQVITNIQHYASLKSFNAFLQEQQITNQGFKNLEKFVIL